MKPLDAEHCEIVNDLLSRGASPEGAYCMGLMTAMIVINGLKPTRELLERASQCRSRAELHGCFNAFIEAEQRKRLRNQQRAKRHGGGR